MRVPYSSRQGDTSALTTANTALTTSNTALTAANAAIALALGFKSKVNFSCTLTSNKTINSHSFAAFNQTDFTVQPSNDNISNPSSVLTFTAPRPGVYYIGAAIEFSGPPDNMYVARVILKKNGVDSVRSNTDLETDDDAKTLTQSCSNVFYLDKDDAITVFGGFYTNSNPITTGSWLNTGTVFYGFNID